MKYLFFILILLFGEKLFAQDSVIPPPVDTTTPKPVVHHAVVPKKRVIIPKDTVVATDTLKLQPESDHTARPLLVSDTNIVFPSWKNTTAGPFFRFTDPLEYSITLKQWEGKEAIFYTMMALLLFFALI